MTKVLLIARNFALRSYLDTHVSSLREVASLQTINVDSVEEFGCEFFPRSLYSIFFELKQLRVLIQKHDPDLVVTIGPKIGLLISIYKLFFSIKNVHWFTGQIWSGKQYRSIYFFVDYFICLMSDNLATDARHQKITIEKYFFRGRDVVFVPSPFSINGVSDDLVRPKSFPEKKRLLYFGRLAPEKGVSFIRDCAAELLELQTVSSLTIAGPLDPDWTTGPEILKELDEIPGVSVVEGYQDKGVALLNCDILLLCSDREGLPVVLIEAIAAGVLPVCTFNEGIYEVMHYFSLDSFISERSPDKFIDIVKKASQLKSAGIELHNCLRPLVKTQFKSSILQYYKSLLCDESS